MNETPEVKKEKKQVSLATKKKMSKSLKETWARKKKEANPTNLDKAEKALVKEIGIVEKQIYYLNMKSAKLRTMLADLGEIPR